MLISYSKLPAARWYQPFKAIIATVPSGCNTVRCLVSPDGKVIWVTARENNHLLSFDAKKLISNDTKDPLISVRVWNISGWYGLPQRCKPSDCYWIQQMVLSKRYLGLICCQCQHSPRRTERRCTWSNTYGSISERVRAQSWSDNASCDGPWLSVDTS